MACLYNISRGEGPRVLHIIDSLGVGGVETWMLELVHLWHNQGGNAPSADFLLTGGKSQYFDDEIRGLGLRIFYLDFRRSTLLTFLKEFRSILQQGRYDVIHDHQGYMSGWHFLMGVGLLPRVRVTHVHNAISDFRTRSILRRVTARIGKYLIEHLSTFIAGTSQQLISQYGFDDGRFIGIPKGPIYCGIDSAKFGGDTAAAKALVCAEFGWPDDARIVLFVGRMDRSPDIGDRFNSKNSGFAVSVGIEAALRESRLYMMFAGERSSAVAILERRIRDAGLGHRICFLGIRLDIPKLMLGSNVLLFPSQGEGLGMVAVEAQAAGMRIMASENVPRECVAVPELISFKSGWSVDEWAEGLVYLLGRDRGEVRASDFQARHSRFSLEMSADSLIRVYSPKVRVLHIVDSLGMGGAETWLMELLKYWHEHWEAGCQFDILVVGGIPKIFDNEARRLGARILYVPFRRVSIFSFFWIFRRILKQGRYDAIHDHQGCYGGWHFLMGAGLLPPVRIAHLHNPIFDIKTRSVSRRTLASIGKHFIKHFATFIASTSQQLITEYGFDGREFNRIPKAAIYCGIDTTQFDGDPVQAKAAICAEFGWPEDAKILLFVGRIDQSAEFGDPRNHKNSGFAVSIAIEAASRESRLYTLIVGESSPAVPILERRIDDAGLSQRIRFLGIRLDVSKLMLGSDILLFPSEAEGLGMVAVEAQSAGMRVLASNRVPREAVLIPAAVELVSLRQPVSAWVDRLLGKLTMPRLAVASCNKRVKESQFSIQDSASRLDRLYRANA